MNIEIKRDYCYCKAEVPEEHYMLHIQFVRDKYADLNWIQTSKDKQNEPRGTYIIGNGNLYKSVADAARKQYPSVEIFPDKEGYIIKTDEFDDSRYFLEIDYSENKASLKPSFLSMIVDPPVNKPYDKHPPVDLFQDLHKQLLPKFEQYYREHKKGIYQDSSEAILMDRLEKLLKVNGCSAD